MAIYDPLFQFEVGAFNPVCIYNVLIIGLNIFDFILIYQLIILFIISWIVNELYWSKQIVISYNSFSFNELISSLLNKRNRNYLDLFIFIFIHLSREFDFSSRI